MPALSPETTFSPVSSPVWPDGPVGPVTASASFAFAASCNFFIFAIPSTPFEAIAAPVSKPDKQSLLYFQFLQEFDYFRTYHLFENIAN